MYRASLALLYEIQHAGSTEFWFLITIILLLCIVGWFIAFSKIRKARIIEDVPTSKIRSAAQGYVELMGNAALMEGPKIFSPLTRTECVWYHSTIEEKRRSGKSSNWIVIESEISESLFLLEDETGACIIDPQDAEVTVREKSVWYGNSRIPAPPKLRGGFIAHLGMGRYRFTERCLTEPEFLYAIGEFRTLGGGRESLSIQQEVRELISKWKHDPVELARFDTSKNGVLELTEWEALRKAAHQEISASRDDRAGSPAINVLSKPKHHPYMLSTLDPEDLVKRYRYIGQLLLALAIVVSAAALFAINVRLFY